MKKLAFALCIFLTGNTAVYASDTPPAGAVAKGNAEAGKTKIATCAACHGADGNSVAPLFPKIAGQHVDYMIKQLQDFKSGARPEPTMAPMAAPLSQQDILDIAAYYSEQKVVVATVDPSAVVEGERIYLGGNKETGLMACASCHGPNGLGNAAAKYPMLSGQHIDYVKKQLENFSHGFRDVKMPFYSLKMMSSVASKMSDKEIQAVAEYISGLH
jgi:cytochrome c553